MMAGIVDKKLKLDAMRRYSGKQVLDDVAHFFSEHYSQFGNASKNWDADKLNAATPTGYNRLAFERMLTQANAQMTFEQFCQATYEEFLNSIPSASVRAVFDPKARSDDRVCIYIDPSHHTLNLEDEWQRTGIVDQRFMYVSRLAVSDWNKVIEYGEYRTYNLCEQTLTETLKSENVFDDVTTVVLLGAGSYSKDREIVRSICSHRSQNESTRVVLVDASFYMLIHTFDKLSQFVSVTGKRCSVEMYCLDFTDVVSWKRAIHFSPTENVAVFLLGGTMGNLRETEFFEVVRDAFPKRSLFVVAGEFFDSREEVEDARERLIERYSQDSAKDLSLTAINDLLNREPVVKSVPERRDFVEVDMKPANLLPADLHSEVPDTQSVFFLTKGKVYSSGRTFDRLYLVTSKRYVKQRFIDAAGEACHLDHVRTVDHPNGEVFSHLIFRKRESS